jgi:hypothetical protein
LNPYQDNDKAVATTGHFDMPALDIASIDRMIGLILYYSYTCHEMKKVVDQTILSHFDGSYLWARLTDTDRAYVILVAPTMASVKPYIEWTKEQPGSQAQGLKSWYKASIFGKKLVSFFNGRLFFLQGTPKS